MGKLKAVKGSLKRKRSKTKKKPSKKAKILKILEFLVRLFIYPFYVSYVFWKTVLIVKPQEIVYAIKEKLGLGYYKSKKYYRKAKKFTVEDQNGDDVDDDLESEDGGEGSKMKKKKKPKMKLLKKLILKVKFLIKKISSYIWRIIKKIKSLKKSFIKRIKWIIKKLYELWLDTERIVFKIKGLPFHVVDKFKTFIKEAIEEPSDNQSYDLPMSKPKFNLPIGLDTLNNASPDELIITKTVTEYPDDTCRPIRPNSSRALVSRGRSQSRQCQSRFSDRIDGSLPARKYRAPPTNEELIDDYFNTYDAIQPHDEAHRNSLSKRKIERIEEDYNNFEILPMVPERPIHTAKSSKGYAKIKKVDESGCDYKKARSAKEHINK